MGDIEIERLKEGNPPPPFMVPPPTGQGNKIATTDATAFLPSKRILFSSVTFKCFLEGRKAHDVKVLVQVHGE